MLILPVLISAVSFVVSVYSGLQAATISASGQGALPGVQSHAPDVIERIGTCAIALLILCGTIVYICLITGSALGTERKRPAR